MKSHILFGFIAMLFATVSCNVTANPDVPRTEFEQIVFDQTGMEVKQAEASFDECSAVFLGCYSSDDLMNFLPYFGDTLQIGEDVPNVIPAANTYYQHNPDGVSADNLTTINGVRIKNPDGTFNIDTNLVQFTWYVNDVEAYHGFSMPYSKIKDVLGCDGVLEFGLLTSYQGHTHYREFPGYINFDDTLIKPCGGIELSQFEVFYNFYPECENAFLYEDGHQYDCNQDRVINMTDLMSFSGQYNNCIGN